MWWKLLLALTVIPAVELFLLLQIGSLVGPTPTFLLLLLTGLLGAYLAKREGVAVLRELAADLQRGLPPAERLAEGALVLLAAVLLITPGVLTDVAGLLLVLPPVRRRLAPRVVGWLGDSFRIQGVETPGEGAEAAAPAEVDPSRPRPTPFTTKFD